MLLHRSDHGSQFASNENKARLAAHGMVLCSRSRRGDCWGSADAESFFATLERELIPRYHWIITGRASLSRGCSTSTDGAIASGGTHPAEVCHGRANQCR